MSQAQAHPFAAILETPVVDGPRQGICNCRDCDLLLVTGTLGDFMPAMVPHGVEAGAKPCSGSPGPTTELKPPSRYRKQQLGKTGKKTGRREGLGSAWAGKKSEVVGFGLSWEFGASKATLTTW